MCYGTCAVVLLGACLAGGVPLAGFPAVSWLAIVALTVGPQFLGHSLFNVMLRRLSATVVSVVALLEVPGAALLAYLLVGQVPAAVTVPGIGASNDPAATSSAISPYSSGRSMSSRPSSGL